MLTTAQHQSTQTQKEYQQTTSIAFTAQRNFTYDALDLGIERQLTKVKFVHNVAAHYEKLRNNKKCTHAIHFKQPHALPLNLLILALHSKKLSSKRKSQLYTQLIVKSHINISGFSIITPISALLIALTSANKGSHSTVQDSPQNQIDIDLSPTVNHLLTGFNCKNPSNVESLELESVE